MRVSRFLQVTFRPLGLILLVAGAVGCSSASKKTPELATMEGKKIALVEVEGSATSRKIVEVALINQLTKRGTFILLNKKELQSVRDKADQDITDGDGLARRAGAEIALRVKVLEFEAEEREGYSEEEVYDSQLAEERGEKEGHTKRLYKVKSLEGRVRVELAFQYLDESKEQRVAVAEARETEVVEEKKRAAVTSPKLRFLETLSNKAFADFFERYD